MTEERFWSLVNKEPGLGPDGDCWEWGGSKVKGYGSFSHNSRTIQAHRFIWQLINGPIDDGFNVLHRCDNPACVRPSHLFLGTQGDNVRDCIRKGRNSRNKRTHCPQGHPYSNENTYIDSRGKRGCRKCRSKRSAAWLKRNSHKKSTLVEGGQRSRVLAAVRSGVITAPKIAEMTGLSASRAAAHLTALRKMNLVLVVGAEVTGRRAFRYEAVDTPA